MGNVMIKRSILRFGIKRRRKTVNEILRQREEQEDLRREYESQRELRPLTPQSEFVPTICGCDREFLTALKIVWD